MNLLMVLIFGIVINTQAPSGFDAEPYLTVLGNTPKALIASLCAYVAGDFVNDNIFRIMKKKDGERKFALRAFLSSVAGELIDSGVFVSVMFIGVLPADVIASIVLTQVVLKLAYEAVILPITSKVAKMLKQKEYR